MGCWAIGGPAVGGAGNPIGWGAVDDEESIRALHRAFDLGVNFYDTAQVYGTGHSEEVVGRAFAGRRDQVVIATKFGFSFDPKTRTVKGVDVSPAHIAGSCDE